MNKIYSLIFCLISFCVVAPSVAAPSDYQDGDIIFIESKSAQSKAIQEATRSRWSHVGILFQKNSQWFVAEAIQPVSTTSLASFIERSKDKDFRVYRLPGLTSEDKKKLFEEARKYMGKSYDIYFEWSDDLIYCSEFVYKVFHQAIGKEIGTVEKFKDQKLDGPYAKKLISRRLKDTGRKLNLEESIVTPISQLNDPDLVLIEKAD